MARLQDKSVTFKSDPRPRAANLAQGVDLQKEMAFLNALDKLAGRGAGYPAEVARRMQVAIMRVGKDRSVTLLGKSARQIQRYCKGDEIPGYVFKVLSDATHASTDWLHNGYINSSRDAEMQREVFDLLLNELRALPEITGQDALDNDRLAAEVFLLDRSKAATTKMAELLTAEDVGEVALSAIKQHYEVSDEFVSVPRYDLQLSAGSGAFIDRAQLLDQIPFTPAFLRRKLGRSTTDGLVMLEARGDSMEPTLGNGDLVMVDMRERDLQGGLMAFVYNDTAFIKRLRPLIGGVEIISDNADLYKPELIDRAQLDELQIIGRVRWIGRVV